MEKIGSIPEFKPSESELPPALINPPTIPEQTVAGYRNPEELEAIQRFNKASKEKEDSADRANWWIRNVGGCLSNTALLIMLIAVSIMIAGLGIVTFPLGTICCLFIPILWVVVFIFPKKVSKIQKLYEAFEFSETISHFIYTPIPLAVP